MSRPESLPTPGPWRAAGDAVITADGRWEICASGDWGGIISDANARLIAAAPDLLEALKKVTKALVMVTDFGTATGGAHPDIQNEALDASRTVQAKAEGRSA